MKKIKGFTLAELLIVVAIIAVLTGISIPVFTSQLEKSREATDIANVRGAYAEMMAAVISDDKDAKYDGSTIKIDDCTYKVSVKLKQSKDNWQGFSEMDIAGISNKDTVHWKGYPKASGLCTILYETTTDNLIINWNGNNLATNLSYKKLCWNRTGQNNTQDGKMISTWNEANKDGPTQGLYELEPNSTYSVSFTYDPHFGGDSSNPTSAIVARAMQLYDSNKKTLKINNDVNGGDSGTGAFVLDTTLNQKYVEYSYTLNDDGTLTYNATFTTPDNNGKPVYYGMNFGPRKIDSNGVTSGDLSFEKDLKMSDKEMDEFIASLTNSFTLEKVNK